MQTQNGIVLITGASGRIGAAVMRRLRGCSGDVVGLDRRAPSPPPSPSWRTFLEQHAHELASIYFFVVPTATLTVLFVLVVLAHDRRRIVHFNVPEHPTAQWTAQQLTEAFPFDTAPRYLLRDGDGRGVSLN